MNILKAWTDKSISERIKWYNDNMNDLVDFLAREAPFSADQLGHAAVELQHIKCHMKMDLRTIPVINASKIEMDYIDAVGQAFLELNNFQNDLGNWFEVLGSANKIILVLKYR